MTVIAKLLKNETDTAVSPVASTLLGGLMITPVIVIITEF